MNAETSTTVESATEPPKQAHFGYIVYLALIAAVPPLATDMYLAAIPKIATDWHVPVSRVSLSLSLWFVIFSAVILLCGPISDRFGRKPVLILGLTLFALGSLLCSFAADTPQLIAFRLLQAIGAAGPTSMVVAICRDKFEGNLRKTVLAWVAIILGLAPMCSPSIGALLMTVFSWRAIFIVQAFMGLLSLILTVFIFKETATEFATGNPFAMLYRYIVLLKNKRFVLANKIMGLITAPFFAFIGFSSIAYIKIFGLSEFYFGIFFALNAIMSISGAYVSTRLNKKLNDTAMIWLCLTGCILGGLLMFSLGYTHYLAFAATMSIITFFTGMSRPISNHLIIEQVQTDIGAASSFITFYQFVLGAIVMWLVTLTWSQPMFVFGLLALVVPIVVMVMWIWLSKLIKVPA